MAIHSCICSTRGLSETFRYTLPISAVDTHRPKPKGSVSPTAVRFGSGREYFVDTNKLGGSGARAQVEGVE
jgi:hypothetical protein